MELIVNIIHTLGVTVSHVDDIEKVIDKHLQKSKYYSLYTLAQKSGIAYITIRHLAKKAGKSNADTIINLLDAVLGPREGIFFLKAFTKNQQSFRRCI